MPIPDFQTVMLPLPETLSDGRVWTMREITGHLAKRYNLSETEANEMLPSGVTTTETYELKSLSGDFFDGQVRLLSFMDYILHGRLIEFR